MDPCEELSYQRIPFFLQEVDSPERQPELAAAGKQVHPSGTGSVHGLSLDLQAGAPEFLELCTVVLADMVYGNPLEFGLGQH